MRNLTATEIGKRIKVSYPKHIAGSNWIAGSSPMESEKHGWEPTPRWHPAYWFGYRWRKHAAESYDPDWDYQTNGQRARQQLAVAFNGGDLGSEFYVDQQSGKHRAAR